MILKSVRNIITGNIMLLICCAFYLAWWMIAFKPTGAIKGLASGWLLIPAALAGIEAIFILVLAFKNAPVDESLIEGGRHGLHQCEEYRRD